MHARHIAAQWGETAERLNISSNLQQMYGSGCTLLLLMRKLFMAKLNMNRAISIIKTPPVRET